MYVVFEAGVRRALFVDLRRLGPILRRVSGDQLRDSLHDSFTSLLVSLCYALSTYGLKSSGQAVQGRKKL